MHSCVMHRQKLVGRRFATHDELRAAGLGNPCWRIGARQRGGPAVALIGAAGSIGAGMAVIGTSALMGGLMIAGGVVSGLGAITGNKTLSTLGMLTGLAGGVGQFMQQGGFESFSQAYQANGLAGVADQFTGQVDYGHGFPGNDVPALDPASQALQDAGSASRAQQIMKESMPNIGAPDQAFGVRDANGGGLLGDSVPAPADSVVAAAPAQSTGHAAANLPTAPSVVPPQDKKDSGLLGLWKNQSDLTKMAVVNAGAGALKGMSEADTNDQLLALKKSQTEAGNALTAAQTAAIEKKTAGVPMASVGAFGANQGATAFGRNADGTSRTYAEYVADRTAALQRLFGMPQPAVR